MARSSGSNRKKNPGSEPTVSQTDLFLALDPDSPTFAVDGVDANRPVKPANPHQYHDNDAGFVRSAAHKQALDEWRRNSDPFKGAPPSSEDDGSLANAPDDVVLWALIKAEYKTGTFTIEQTAKRHGVKSGAIRARIARAKKNGDLSWARDSEKAVAVMAADQLDKDLAAGMIEGPIGPEMMAKSERVAAAARIQIVREHRRDISRVRRIGSKFLDRLDQYMHNEDVDGPFLGGKESPADVMKKVADAMRFLIPLERQAFGIEEGNGEAEKDKAPGIAFLPAKKPLSEAESVDKDRADVDASVKGSNPFGDAASILRAENTTVIHDED